MTKRTIYLIVALQIAIVSFSIYSFQYHLDREKEILELMAKETSKIYNALDYSTMLNLEDDGYGYMKTNIDTSLLVRVEDFQPGKENEVVINLKIGNPLNITYDHYTIYMFFYNENLKMVKDVKYNTNEIIKGSWNKTRYFVPGVDFEDCKFVEIGIDVGEVEL
jgi:hypothetical protein